MRNGETSELFGDDMESAISAMLEAQDALMNTMMEIGDLQEAINEAYLESIDKQKF